MGSNAITDTAEVADSPTDVAKGETVDRGGNSSQPISSKGKVSENSATGKEKSGETQKEREKEGKAREGGQGDLFAEAERLAGEQVKDQEAEKSRANGAREAERAQGAEARPSFLDAVQLLYTKGREVAAKLYRRSFFDVVKTPDFMKRLGLSGDRFTIRYGVIARHFGKDSSHSFTQSEWEQIPNAIEHPFAIAKLTDKDRGYRIYTSLKTEKDEYVVVGVDVKNAGRDMEVNSIATIFGRRNGSNLPLNEEVLYGSETITPEQQSLLGRPNSDQYPAGRELSDGKGSEISDILRGNGLTNIGIIRKIEELLKKNYILFLQKGNVYIAVGSGASTVSELTGLPVENTGNKQSVTIPSNRFDKLLQKIIASGLKVVTANVDTDRQGNPRNADGTLKLERLSNIDELTDADFSKPYRNVELPKLPSNVDGVIGASGKPVIIKKNIFEKNLRDHSDLTPTQSREILSSALYHPDLYGQNQKARRPYNWVVINTKDKQGLNRLVLLELNDNKGNVEIVHWHYIDERGLGKIKRQAEREDGQLLILPSVAEEAGALSSLTPNLSSASKGTAKASEKPGKGGKKEKLGFNSKTGKWKGVPKEAGVLSTGEPNRFGIIKGFTDNSRVDLMHNTVSGRTWIRVHTYDRNAETPVRINRILEQEGYYVDIDGSSSGFVEFDNYEDAMRFADHVNDVQSQVDAERLAKQLKPVGKGAFGDVYDQFKGKAKEAFNFLAKHRSRDLLGVFHRDDTGDIDLIWGDENGGLCHILAKHVGKGRDFETEQDAFDKIEGILEKGRLIQDGPLRYVVSKDGYRVAIRKDYDGVNKNWIVTAIDYNRSKEEKGITTNPTSASHGANGPELAAPNNSAGKGTANSGTAQADTPKNKKGHEELSDREESAGDHVQYHRGDAVAPLTPEERVLRDAVIDRLRESGLEVITDAEEGQRVLDMANGNDAQVRLQANLSALFKATNIIRGWLTNNKRGKTFRIELPLRTQRMVREVMGRDFESHNITANGIAHAQKNHGVNGQKLNGKSIPLTESDMELIPYIMVAPDYVGRGSDDATGRTSVRFYKELSNGYVVVVEKEYKNSPDDMETITMWAEKSDKATNARSNAAPDTHVLNAILDIDTAKIRQDAETAIAKESKFREHRVYHGSGADFTEFDHSHMGEGEGAQAYGWGTYVTEVKEIAVNYGSNRLRFRGLKDAESVIERLMEKARSVNYDLSLWEADSLVGRAERLISRGEEDYGGLSPKELLDFVVDDAEGYENELLVDTLRLIKPEDLDLASSHLYTVEIPDDNGRNYLDYKGRCYARVLNRINKALEKAGLETIDPKLEASGMNGVLRGQDVYQALSRRLKEDSDQYRNDKKASQFLSRIGIYGAQNEAYMCRSAENVVRGLCFNELGVGG